MGPTHTKAEILNIKPEQPVIYKADANVSPITRRNARHTNCVVAVFSPKQPNPDASDLAPRASPIYACAHSSCMPKFLDTMLLGSHCILRTVLAMIMHALLPIIRTN